MSKIHKAIELVSQRNKYQKMMLIVFILIYLELGLILLGSSFIFMNPTFSCPGMTDPSEDDACPILKQCKITNNFTITAYADLICDQQNSRSLIQSAPYIGSIIGLLLLTPFADQKGKKFMFVRAQGLLVFGILLNIIGAFAKTAAIMVIGQICIGAGCYTVMIVGYVILSQLTSQKFKQISIITLNAVWAISQIIISGLYFWYNEWFNYVVLILFIPNVGLLLYTSFYLVESPYFLIQKKRDVAEAMKSMEIIAMYNEVNRGKLVEVESIFKQVIRDIEQTQKLHTNAVPMSRFSILKDVKYLKIMLLVAVVQIGANLYYYGVQFSLGQIGTSFGYNILLAGVIETIAFFCSNIFITKLPRKKGMFVFTGICILLGLLFFFNAISDNNISQTILLGACRFFNTFMMAIIPMLQNQPFPHKYRSVAWGYIEGISQMGNFLAPFIVTACQNGGINPLIICSLIIAIICTVPMVFIKETLSVNEDELQVQDIKESFLTNDGQSLQEGTLT